MKNSKNRIYKSIKNAINEFQLDLSGEIVLSELGTNEYAYVSFIPIIANAKKVIIICKDNSLSENLKLDFINFANYFNISSDSYLFLNKKDLVNVKHEITIISNCGNVRPIDSFLIDGMNQLKVVGLMYDAWELRGSDVDVEFLSKNKIKLVAVNETHSNHDIFSYVGPLSTKLCFDSNHEVLNENILVWSGDEFGNYISKFLKNFGANQVILTNQKEVFYENLSDLDIVILVDYNFEGEYFGVNGFFDEKMINNKNPSITFIHMFGKLNSKENLEIFPLIEGNTKKMSKTFSYLGFNPLYRLISAGFKVCEEVLKNQLSNLSKPINF